MVLAVAAVASAGAPETTGEMTTIDAAALAADAAERVGRAVADVLLGVCITARASGILILTVPTTAAIVPRVLDRTPIEASLLVRFEGALNREAIDVAKKIEPCMLIKGGLGNKPGPRNESGHWSDLGREFWGYVMMRSKGSFGPMRGVSGEMDPARWSLLRLRQRSVTSLRCVKCGSGSGESRGVISASEIGVGLRSQGTGSASSYILSFQLFETQVHHVF